MTILSVCMGRGNSVSMHKMSHNLTAAKCSSTSQHLLCVACNCCKLLTANYCRRMYRQEVPSPEQYEAPFPSLTECVSVPHSGVLHMVNRMSVPWKCMPDCTFERQCLNAAIIHVPTWKIPLQIDICDSVHHSSADSGLSTQGVLCCVEHRLYQTILLLPDWTQLTVRASLLFTIVMLANKVH